MRNGTFIIPATGERSRRQFTLRTPRNRSRCNGSERRPPTNSVTSVGQHLQAASRALRTKSLAAWRWLQTDEGRQEVRLDRLLAITPLDPGASFGRVELAGRVCSI